MFWVLIPIVILTFFFRDWMIKFFRIPKVFNYKISIFLKLFITSPGSSCISFSLGTSIEVPSFVLPCSTSLPTGSNSPSNDRLTGSFCYFQNSVLCAGVKQYNRATLTGDNITSYLLHPAVAHYHPHNHQGQKVASQKTVYEPSQYSHSQSLVPDLQHDCRLLLVCIV